MEKINIKLSSYDNYAGAYGVAIESPIPAHFKGSKCVQLFPSETLISWFNDRLSSIGALATPELRKVARKKLYADFSNNYYEETLKHLDPKAFAEALDGKVLLSHAPLGNYGCRNAVAEWLRKNGYEVSELIPRRY